MTLIQSRATDALLIRFGSWYDGDRDREGVTSESRARQPRDEGSVRVNALFSACPQVFISLERFLCTRRLHGFFLY